MGKEGKIQEYERKYSQGQYCPNQCFHCHSGSDLKEKEAVIRLIRYWEEFHVRIKELVIGVWFCKRCMRSFRYLPEFLQRFKRYMSDCLVECCDQYLNEEHVSTRNSAEANLDIPRLYDDRAHAFSHSTIWRWTRHWANMLVETKSYWVKNGLPVVPLDSIVFSCISKWKYHSQPRHKTLQKAQEYLYRFKKGKLFSAMQHF